jgi:hypothetical protein
MAGLMRLGTSAGNGCCGSTVEQNITLVNITSNFPTANLKSYVNPSYLNSDNLISPARPSQLWDCGITQLLSLTPLQLGLLPNLVPLQMALSLGLQLLLLSTTLAEDNKWFGSSLGPRIDQRHPII